MKQTILSIILAVPLTAMAQGDGHGYRAGDVLRKQQVAWMAEGEAGVNVVWDFSRMEVVNGQRYVVKVIKR